MTINEYQINAMKFANGMRCQSFDELLVNGVMGLCGESGECIDMVKKASFQRHDFDEQHFAKELGDVAWYLAVSAYAIGYDLETIFQMNIDKLTARYLEGKFSVDRSLHRKDGDI